ncbi:FAD-binding oxidoreductase [Silvibacterium dinghuense]|uniref:FAD-binding oxidoreductase n=1 Tax=Silvibacterium dinghuense TaxID=1560006 RepID=A0A4Q1SIU1_9BACT|nr:FAD-binding oxidoreductase [Silvibacterium dinghuense]RXS97526.1 FAD-binding oxidoreductase [Silvibacterium dinghuense]GGG99731.1 FAD-linked oxidase [Silvibacterium dinghuense]
MAKSKPKPSFESWGRYPRLDAKLVPLHWRGDFPLRKAADGPMLPVGAGRSYGDVCLLEGGTLLHTRGMDRLIAFDPQSGLLRCEAGITLAEILDFAVPRGFFLPVTPGTKYVTVGGAIANDIHGKNHHSAGSFGCHVPRFELVRSDGTRILCSPTENAEWFRATVGGMGLTGLITWAEIRLRPIVSRMIDYQGDKFVGLDEFFTLANSAKTEYTVAWIDCVSTGRNFARGIFMHGEHATIPGSLKKSKEPWLTFPIDLPEIALNKFSMAAFNTAYYNKQLKKQQKAVVDYEPYFYPLDSVLQWNKMYGKAGLLQFQNVIPFEAGKEGMAEILKAITRSGLASFLAVIKFFGDIPSPGMMSFPAPGVMLALDFPIRHEVSFDLLDRLAAITLDYGGRMYSAKDARMTAAQYQTFYPNWQAFLPYIDPAFDSAFWQRVTGRRAIDA